MYKRQPEQVEIHTTFLGGGFGRRANPRSDFVIEAVQVALAVSKPVKVMWTREDDMRGGRDVPALMCTDCATAMAEGGFTSVVDFMFSTHPACPLCSARHTCGISYGFPAGPPPPWACSGGCVVGSTSPRWQCAECGHEWS